MCCVCQNGICLVFYLLVLFIVLCSVHVVPSTLLPRLLSGVTRVKGQPGQLTNKQLSRRSWVGGEPLTALETHHGSFLDFHLNLCISRHMISEMTRYSVLYTVF